MKFRSSAPGTAYQHVPECVRTGGSRYQCKNLKTADYSRGLEGNLRHPLNRKFGIPVPVFQQNKNTP